MCAGRMHIMGGGYADRGRAVRRQTATARRCACKNLVAQGSMHVMWCLVFQDSFRTLLSCLNSSLNYNATHERVPNTRTSSRQRQCFCSKREQPPAKQQTCRLSSFMRNEQFWSAGLGTKKAVLGHHRHNASAPVITLEFTLK